MRTNGFCLALTEAAERSAVDAARRMDRARREVRVLRLTKGASVVALSMGEGEEMPAVHGLPAGAEGGWGEYAVARREGQYLVCSRDKAGTRPLLVDETRGMAATDWRFFPGGGARMLPLGATFTAGRGVEAGAQQRMERFQGTFEEAAVRLAELVSASVERRTRGQRKVCVAFSGGLDSSMVAHCAKKAGAKVVACSVNIDGSFDQRNAPRMAESLGIELRVKTIGKDEVSRELGHLALPFEPSSMDKALWCIYTISSRMAKEEGSHVIMLGQLADELFGGYAKYLRTAEGQGPAAAERMMTADAAGCSERGFVRDELACARWLEARFPFADESVLELASSLPLEYKIRKGERKAVLRRAAALLGIPDEVLNAPKKAAQYSSGLSKIIG